MQLVFASWISHVACEIVFSFAYVSPWCGCALFFSLFYGVLIVVITLRARALRDE